MTMRKNPIKTALQSGSVVIGTGLTLLKGAAVPQLYAASGIEFVWIDMQHTTYTIENIFELVVGARAAGLGNFVRVPEPDRALITRLLDGGVEGVMIPEIKTPEAVIEVVEAVKYPPQGKRSLVSRGMHTDFEPAANQEMTRAMNEQSLIVIQIETKSAYERLEEIAQVPGVDALWVGPNDLSFSLGYFGQTGHPAVLDAIDRIISVCIQNNIFAGLTIGYDFKNAERWLKKGLKFIAFSKDIELILKASATGVQKIRTLL
jgi:2-keto-3-deoxy-L-rhamnonate aldolase RhmA